MGARGAAPDQRASAVRAGAFLGPRGDGSRPGAVGPEEDHADPRGPRGKRRRVRERRAMAPPAVLPGARRGSGGRGRSRMPGGAHLDGRSGRVDARQDRGRRAGRRRLPGPDVHEPDVEPRGRLDPLRVHARARRDGVRRWRRDAARRGSLPHHDDDGRRGGRPRPVRGMAPDRMARTEGLLHERDRAVGGRRRRWTGRHVWDAVVASGAVPYGTEAMHVLRAEKGYVIVGQETDGTVTPDDLGMGWIVNPSKGDFVGKRSLVRADTLRKDRKRLVALLPHDRSTLLVEGSQLVGSAELPEPPVPMLGHVTSSYRSAILERTFALAMLKDGRAMRGGTVWAVSKGDTIACEVTDPVVYDPED